MRALTRIQLLVLAAGLLLLTVPAAALAGDPDESADKSSTKKGHGVTVELDDDQLTFICRSGGEDRETVVDLSGLDELIAEAMAGVGEALEELEDMQLDLQFGENNMVRLTTPDQEIEVNLELVAAQVGRAVETALAELEHQDWSHGGNRHRVHVDLDKIEATEDMDDLQSELDALRREMADLKRELKQLHEDR